MQAAVVSQQRSWRQASQVASCVRSSQCGPGSPVDEVLEILEWLSSDPQAARPEATTTAVKHQESARFIGSSHDGITATSEKTRAYSISDPTRPAAVYPRPRPRVALTTPLPGGNNPD